MEGVAKLHIPRVLEQEYEPVAQELLKRYFMHGADGRELFTGACFETLGRRTAADSANVFEPEDLIAATTLSVEVPARAAIAILGPYADELTQLLSRIPMDLSLVDATDEILLDPGAPAQQLWERLRSCHGIGRTTASKLMARKRPDLIPILDSVVEAQYGLKGGGGFWAGMRGALQRDDRALHRRACRFVVSSGVEQRISPLRAIDVVVWMDGKDPSRTRDIAAQHGLLVPGPRVPGTPLQVGAAKG